MLALLAEVTEPDKTWFYVAGVVLVLWAFGLFFMGTRSTKWPDSLGGQRMVITISAVLVAATMGAAVATS
jgi:hypothetical protein